MNGKTHMLIGAAAGMVDAALFDLSPSLSVVLVSAYIVGALLPDLDAPRSTASHKTGTARGLGALAAAPLRAAVGGHRGMLHSFYPVLGLFVLFYWLGHAFDWWALTTALFGLMGGYASHVLADALTPRGVRLLWPLLHVSGPLGDWVNLPLQVACVLFIVAVVLVRMGVMSWAI